ncbi:MAG: serine/threonine protein kinase, partial [Planctomycetia bacterium]|nr:serine/threonine protein kinase [Planctomycetia bacterium]
CLLPVALTLNRVRADKYAPHTTVGPFRLLSRVATSQACEIWEASREPGGTRHALKVMLPSRTGDRAQIDLLRREYAVGRQLNHPLVIRVDEFAVDNGVGYLAMEYFPAPNLKQVMRQGGEAWLAAATRVAQQTAEALGAIHNQGWIHRDVKPENFLVALDGPDGPQVKLIDVSLGRKIRGWWGRLLTSGPKAEGTRSYMSPEQIRRRPQDRRADIYSLGCMYFEMASGKPPYAAATAQELLQKHLRLPPPSLKSANPLVSDRFAALVKNMLAKEPQDRPESMEAVARELRLCGESGMFTTETQKKQIK